MAAGLTPSILDPKVLLDVTILTTSATGVSFTAPASEAGVHITGLWVVNYGTVGAKFNVQITPSGGSAAQIASFPVSPDYKPYRVDIIGYLDAGDKIEMGSDTATTLKVWIEGEELKD